MFILRMEKECWFVYYGVDYLIEIVFIFWYVEMILEEFVRDYLINLNLLYIVVGFEFNFGKGCDFDVDLFWDLCKFYDIGVIFVLVIEIN